MSDFPIHVLLLAVLAVAAAGYFFFRGRAAAASYDRQYSNYRAGTLAQRLGLHLLQGDPHFNVFIPQAHIDTERGPTGGRPVHIQVRAEGTPHGVPLEFLYLYRVEQDTGFTQVTWHVRFDCRLTARARQPFPPFEVISRTLPARPIAQTLPLPRMPTGNAAVDRAYLVTTEEPGMAQALGELLLPGFATFVNSGVHLVGDGNRISFVMHHDRSPLLANALYYAEALGTQVSQVARRLGG